MKFGLKCEGYSVSSIILLMDVKSVKESASDLHIILSSISLGSLAGGCSRLPRKLKRRGSGLLNLILNVA